MLRSPLYQDDYRPQLSGHETFPIRYGWLKKAFDGSGIPRTKGTTGKVFSGSDAIARFGVGKNMVSSMRHWAKATGMIKDAPGANGLTTTSLGHLVFGDPGLDPYMEHPATAWLLHWNLCSRSERTTWYWVFHHYSSVFFEREALVQGIAKLAEDRKWSRASIATIRRDVSCFIRTYAAQAPSGHESYEDGLESPLIELGLVKPAGRRDGFHFVRGPKPSLGPGVFGYAVTDFWDRSFGNSNTLSFEAMTHGPGSPGRAFLLEENDMVDMLVELEDASGGIYRWSETAGLKQLIRTRAATDVESFELLKRDYMVEGQPELSRASG